MRIGLIASEQNPDNFLAQLDSIHHAELVDLNSTVDLTSLAQKYLLVIANIQLSELNLLIKPLLKLAGLQQRPRIIINLHNASRAIRIELELAGIDQVLDNASFSELLARSRAALRLETAIYRQFTVVPGKPDVRLSYSDAKLKGKLDTKLTEKELSILKAFTYQHRQVLSREEIIDFVWGSEHHFERSTLNVYMHKLRQKLAAAGAAEALKTLPGRGYRLYYQAS